MSEFDLYIPLKFNNGRPVPKREVESVKGALIKAFGGVTNFRHRNEGIWRLGSVTYRDEILLLRVLAQKTPAAQKKLQKIALSIQQRFRQKEVLIVERKVQLFK